MQAPTTVLNAETHHVPVARASRQQLPLGRARRGHVRPPARLHVLYLTHHGPWPASSGGRARDAALLPRLAKLTNLEVWAVSRTPEEDRRAFSRHAPALPHRIYPDESERRAFPSRSSAAARHDLEARMAGRRPFDAIHVEGHYLFHLLPPGARDRSVVVEHNVESHLLGQRAALSAAPGRFAGDLATVMRTEQEAWLGAARVLTLTPEDHDRILARPLVHVSSSRLEAPTTFLPPRPSRPQLRHRFRASVFSRTTHTRPTATPSPGSSMRSSRPSCSASPPPASCSRGRTFERHSRAGPSRRASNPLVGATISLPSGPPPMSSSFHFASAVASR